MNTSSHYFERQYGKDFRIPTDFGIGTENETIIGSSTPNPTTYRVRCVALDNEKLPKEVSLDVHNILFSIGAVHHYCKLSWKQGRLIDVKTGERFGWSAGAGAPDGMEGGLIEMTRRVDKRDLKHDKDEAKPSWPRRYGSKKLIAWKSRAGITIKTISAKWV